MGREVGREEDGTKLPFTSCSSDPRMDELPSELLPSFDASDLLPALLSLLPLGGETGSELGVARKRGLPTHCCMWGMKISIGIFSSQRSQSNLPDSMISLAEMGEEFPATSCLARSSSSSFLTGSAFFLSLEAKVELTGGLPGPSLDSPVPGP